VLGRKPLNVFNIITSCRCSCHSFLPAQISTYHRLGIEHLMTMFWNAVQNFHKHGDDGGVQTCKVWCKMKYLCTTIVTSMSPIWWDMFYPWKWEINEFQQAEVINQHRRRSIAVRRLCSVKFPDIAMGRHNLLPEELGKKLEYSICGEVQRCGLIYVCVLQHQDL